MTVSHRVLSALLIAGCLLSCNQKEIDIPTPKVSFTDIITTEYESASISCSVNGNFTAEKLTIQYSKDNTFSNSQSVTADKTGLQFYIIITGLEVQTTYYYRHIISNKINSYSDGVTRNFQTMAYSKPEVKTVSADDITARSATLEGKVLFDGGRPVLEKGFYLGEDKNNLVKYPIQAEDFAFTFTELKSAATYYYQAFAQNEQGIGLGEVLTFTTRDGVPQLQVNSVTDITPHSVFISGEIKSDGGSPITERGFCYSDTETPTVNSTKAIVEGNDNPFGTELYDLKPATTYQVRVYAVNDTGIYYGDTSSFSTLPIEVTSVTLDKTELTLSIGEKTSLIATVYPEDATDKTVLWSSTDPEVAYSDQSGMITTLKGGSTTIIARSGNCSATCAVTVIVPVSIITLNPNYLTLEEGQTYTLTAWITPKNATDQTITWSSQDPSVASVENGVITAIKEGSTSIRAQAGNAIDHCAVVVKKNPKNEPISFVDSKIKEKLVAAFDTNSDGELSYNEAAKVTSLANVFGSETGFTSFDEFQYFDGLTTVDANLFDGWENLKSVVLPKTIKSINQYAFRNCYNMSMVALPESIQQIGSYAFYGCSNMKGQLVLPQGLTTLSDYSFFGCSGLSGDLILPSSLSGVGQYAFCDCTGLNGRLVLPKKTNSAFFINGYAFHNCSNFTGDLIIDELVRTENHAFDNAGFTGNVYIARPRTAQYYEYWGCKIGGNLIIQDNVEAIDGNPFRGASVGGYIYIGKNVSSLSYDALFSVKCKTIYVAAITPPTCATSMSISLKGCYLGVPKGRKETYSNISPWNEAETIEEVDFSNLQITPPND